MSTIVEHFLTFRNLMKIYHWQTTSFARHTASDKLVTGIDALIDQFMEVYLGKYPRFVMGETPTMLIDVYDRTAPGILNFFKNFLMNDLPKEISNMSNSDLLNIRDEMLGLVNQTLYLFTLKE